MSNTTFSNDIPGFSGFLRRNAARFRMIVELVAAAFAFADPRTPAWAKALIGAAIAYVLCPFDAIPDFIPVAGWADDIGVLGTALAGAAGACITDEHREKSRSFLGIR